MRLATWNINSIKIRHERVRAWLAEKQPDVLCLQELKTDDAHVLDEYAALGYQAAVHGQKTYNGVAILSRHPLEDVTRGFGDGGDDSQARAISATVRGVRVVSVYVPNGQAVGTPKFEYKLAWMARLRTFLEARGEGPLAVCGDFNVAPEPIDVHDPVAWDGACLFSAPERAALSRLVELGLVDVWRSLNPGTQAFSWWDYRLLGFPKNHGLRIDHIFANAALAARASSAVIDREARKGKQPSDHAPVVAEFRDA